MRPAGARIVVAATGDFEQLAYQTDHEYVLELRPRPKAAVVDPTKKEYKGERLTLNFQDIETRAVLQLLADTSGQNIVVSDTVQGNVTLRLQNVPWDQALDIVLRTKGLDKRQEGNVIYVAPAEELAAREKQLLESQKSLTELAPLRTEYLQVNYAKASDLAALIKLAGQDLAAVRARQRLDRRAHQHPAAAGHRRPPRRHPPPGATLDIPVQQVLIEARIVIVNDDFSRDLGVRFGGAFVGNYGSNDGLMWLGSQGLQQRRRRRGPIISPTARAAVGIDGNSVATAPVPDRYIVNLPVANPAGRLALTLLDSDYVVDLEISAAQAEGRGEVVSAPRVITANGKEASIEQGVEIPVPGVGVERRHDHAVQEGRAVAQGHAADHAGRPHHPRPDGQQGQRRPGRGRARRAASCRASTPARSPRRCWSTTARPWCSAASSRPSAATRSNKVPFLGDIPGLGFLFRSKSKDDNKDELLIFVTPKILREGADIY